MAGKIGQIRHPWTDEQRAWLTQYYRQYGKKKTYLKFNLKFKVSLSQPAVQSMARKLGLQGQEDDSRFTTVEVCSMLGMCARSLRKRIQRGTVKAVKVLDEWLIDSDELDRLAEWHRTDIPWPAITTSDAAERLGYSRINLNFLIQRGSLTGVKRGAIWMVKLSEIEAAEQYMKRTGHVRVPWAKLKQQAEKDLTQ